MGAQYPLLERDPDTHVGIARPAIDFRPFTGGLFHDFSTGAPGVAILGGEPACPSYIDATTISGAGSVLAYAAASEVLVGGVPFTGIPLWAKITSTTGASQKLSFSALSFVDKAVSCGRAYVYFPINITQTRLASLIGGDGSVTALRLNTARTLSILDSGNIARGTSTFALLAGVVYRIEWRAVYANGQVTFQVWIFTGHGTTPVDTFTTTAFATTATLAGAAEFGNANAANLAGKFLYMAALACNCDAPPGPYLRREVVQSITSPDGSRRMEMTTNGDIVVRAVRAFKYTDGGTDIYLVQPGDEMGRWGGDGFRVGPGTGVGDPTQVQDMSTRDTMANASNRRLTAESFNVLKNHDPPDTAYMRTELINSPEDVAYGYVGHKGSIGGANGDELTVDASDIVNVNPRIWPNGWFFPMRRRGHGIQVAGASYNIAEVLGPLTVKLTPKPAATGTNLTWKLKIFPYPLPMELSGIGQGGTLGQPSRMVPMAFAPIAKGSSGVSTTSGSAVVDISALSAQNKAFWTVGRRVLINKDPTLAVARQGKCFKILSVAGDGNSVTLDGTVPQTLSNKQWHLAGSDDDGGGQKYVFVTETEAHDAQCDVVNWDTGLAQGWSTVKWQMPVADALWEVGVSEAPTAFQINPAGGAEAIAGLGLMENLAMLSRREYGYQQKQGAGGSVTQATNKSTGATLNKLSGRIIMNGAALAAGASVSFVVSNSLVAANDGITVTQMTGTAGAYACRASNAIAGTSFVITIENRSGGSLSEAVQLQVNISRGSQT